MDRSAFQSLDALSNVAESTGYDALSPPLHALSNVAESTGYDALSPPLQIALLLGSLALLSSILVSVTSFTRIIIVLSFVRSALNVQEIPPNASLIGLALFMTVFTMAPVFDGINESAIKPYMEDRIDGVEAFGHATDELRSFMLQHTRLRDLALFIHLSNSATPATAVETPIRVLIPAFMISELKTAFVMGFCIYVPFILIDLLISTILMSLGMMMMPPVIVSAPIKLLLFVLVDGWHLVAHALGTSFL